MATKQLDVETTTEDELASVPGITGKRAKDIIRVRDGNGGRFTTSDLKALKLASATQKRILQNEEILFSDSKPLGNAGNLLPQVTANVGKSETGVDDKPIVTGLVPSTGVSTGAVTSVSSGVEGATGVSTGGTKHISGNAGKFELGASVRSKTKTENTTSGDDSSDSSISSKKSTGKSGSIQKSLKRLIRG